MKKQQGSWYKNDPKWIKKAEEIKTKIENFGKKVGKFTEGKIETYISIISGEDVLEPIIFLCIEIKGNDKNTMEFKEMLREERFRFYLSTHDPQENFFEDYKKKICLIKNLAIGTIVADKQCNR